MSDSSSSATEIAALIALAGVFVSASVAYVTASRSVYVNAVTGARIQWIEKIRDLIVEFRELQLKISIDSAKGLPDNDSDHYNINKIYETLHLSLGSGKNENNIMDLSRCCLLTVGHFDMSSEYSGLLAAHTRWLLDREWSRVKLEASNILMHPIYSSRLFRKDTDYLYFCRKEGEFADIIADPFRPKFSNLSPRAAAARP